MPTVRLYECEGIGLIVKHASGVMYENNTGGYACVSAQVEGVYLPFQNSLSHDQQQELEHHFTGPKWNGRCSDGIDDETADFVDSILLRSPYTKGFKVDRATLKDCRESWIHVIIGPGIYTPESDPIVGFPTGNGVLTWWNSD